VFQGQTSLHQVNLVFPALPQGSQPVFVV